MNYPLISEYIEAIKASEENFEQLNHLRPVLGEDGEPVMTSGNFAVVFKMKNEQTGKLHAVKCFLKEQEGRAEAYRQIAEELEYVSSTFLTPIKYLDKELFVDSANSEDSEFPVLLMDWVEGQTLDKYIREHIEDQYELSLLAYQFSRLAMWLMPQPFAHGDLKPDNILVKEDGTLVLVDYDGMYVPAMKGQKARELGSLDFRHPSRTEEVFDEHIDDFSLASILLSLKAISLQPSLLEEYGASDRLLFSEKDYRNLSESIVMDALKPLMQDAELASLYSLYILALSQNNLSQVSFRLFNLSRPDKSQYEDENLSTEVTEDDLANAWTDVFGVEYNKEKVLLLKAPKDIEKYTVIEGIITIGNAAFSNCNNLKSVIIANSITEIGHYAFANCNSLYLFAIPQNVRKLGSGAFMGCSELTSILLPNSIVFESDTFEGCEKLASVFVPQGEKFKYEGLLWNYDIDIKEYDPNDEEEKRMLNSIYHGILDEHGVLYDYDEEILLSVTKPLEEYSVREGTIGIRVEAFKPDTMGIDRKSLKRLHLPDSLFMICDSAFVYNEGLEYINVPKNAKFLQDSNPFAGCFNLHRIKWETDNAVKEGTLIFNKERTALIACLPCQYTEGNTIIEQDSHVILPDGLETIAANTFYHDEKLQEISLPASIKEIGKDAFIGCSSLKSIYIPEGTLYKFKKMLPEWAGILKEQYKEVEDYLSEYELPDGSIYNGRCIRKPFGSIELNGLGSISYTNGDKYKGNFKYGRPYGWGIFFFNNGHKHKGYFIDTPNGIGYLNEDYDMAVGNFTNGRLNGWAICYRNRIFKFGYWREGKLITDYTTKTLWIRHEISNQRIEYKGNLIQMDEEHNFIRFGIPEKPLVNTYGNGIKNIWSLKEFFKAHGRMKIANMVNKNTQEHYKCLAFENPTTGVLTFVSFSSSLGELSGAEINTMKNELVVCELNVEPKVAARRAKEGRQIESYSLCKMSAIPASQIPLSRVPKMPAYGFEFFKDGTVKVGIVRYHDSGEYMLCNKDGTVECGKWKENIKTSNNSSFDLDNPENQYEENGIDVYKK